MSKWHQVSVGGSSRTQGFTNCNILATTLTFCSPCYHKRKNCHVSTALQFSKILDLELGIGVCYNTFQDDPVYEGMMSGVVGYHRIS